MLIDPTTHNDCGGYNHYNWSKNQGLICSSLVAWLLIFFHTRTATDAAQLAALVQMEVKCLVQGYLNDVIRVRCCALTWVVAASLILTSYWSSGTAHAEFSWLKLTERNQWMGCCTEEKKEPNCSCEAGVSFCHYCSFSSLFSFTLQALHSFFFLYSTFTVKWTWVFFRSQTDGRRNPQPQQPPSTSQHLLSQMGADGHKTPNRTILKLFFFMAVRASF